MTASRLDSRLNSTQNTSSSCPHASPSSVRPRNGFEFLSSRLSCSHLTILSISLLQESSFPPDVLSSWPLLRRWTVAMQRKLQWFGRIKAITIMSNEKAYRPTVNPLCAYT